MEPYPGGTFFEVAVLQGRLEAFLVATWELGFRTVEVSDGTIDLCPGSGSRRFARPGPSASP